MEDPSDQRHAMPLRKDCTTRDLNCIRRRRFRSFGFGLVRSSCYARCLFFVLLNVPLSSSQDAITTAPLAPFSNPTLPPTVTMTAAPSTVPTMSPAPSNLPTESPVPTVSAEPSSEPSWRPSDVPTELPSHMPSDVPTISLAPSSDPSSEPSLEPSVSSMPSSEPSVSMQPSFSREPSSFPSFPPTNSRPPSAEPTSQHPSMMPSNEPPSEAPSPGEGFIVASRQFIVMALIGVEMDVLDVNSTWRRTTSRHVGDYWRSFDRNVQPFFIRRVVTVLKRETRIPRVPPVQAINASDPYPMDLEITYSQEITYLMQTETAPSPFDEDQLFLAPFVQDALGFTTALNLTLNNPHVILLNFTGFVKDPVPPRRDKNAIIIVVVVVALALIAASAYILYLTRFKDDSTRANANERSGGEGSDIMRIVVGTNPSDNILISESYDDEFDHVIDAGLLHPAGNFDSGGNLNLGSGITSSGTPDSDEHFPPIPPANRQQQQRDDGTYPTVSTVPLTVTEAERGDGGDYQSSGQWTSFRSQNSSNQNSSNNLMEVTDPEFMPASPVAALGDDSGDFGDDDGEDDSSGPQVPFMSGFQMEIRDLDE